MVKKYWDNKKYLLITYYGTKNRWSWQMIMINDRLRVSKLYWEIRIPTIYNFAVIYSWNLLF